MKQCGMCNAKYSKGTIKHEVGCINTPFTVDLKNLKTGVTYQWSKTPPIKIIYK